MTAKKNPENIDVEEIIPEEGELTIGGIRVRVKRLKTREFFSLLRVITSGLGPAIQNFNFSQDLSEGEMGGQVIAMATFAIPNALDEFTVFLRDIIEPVGPVDQGKLNEAMANPEIDETLEIITMIVTQEAADFRSLMGKAQATISKMPQVLKTAGK